ncbi:hypothetical protein KQH49_09905 [Mycetohabitans sp. B5]|nr:hypothetical protein [Mycetohabitans sp. B5]
MTMYKHFASKSQLVLDVLRTRCSEPSQWRRWWTSSGNRSPSCGRSSSDMIVGSSPRSSPAACSSMRPLPRNGCRRPTRRTSSPERQATRTRRREPIVATVSRSGRAPGRASGHRLLQDQPTSGSSLR